MTRLRFLVGGLLLVVAACRDPASGAGTALFVTITYDGTVTQLPTQFSFSAQDTTANRAVFSGYLDPSSPASAGIQGPATVLLELSHHPEVVGDTLVVHVDGLVGANVVGSGNSPSVVVKNGLTVQVPVTLSVGGPGDAGQDGGSDAGGGGDGGADGGGDAGPGCAGCTTCCSLGSCVPAIGLHTCGIDGGQCLACPALSADTCNTTLGTCACGNGPACSGTSDTCLGDGGCVCGDAGAPCPANESCNGGTCQCGNGSTCPAKTACDTLGQCICSADAGCVNGCCVRAADGGNDSCGVGTANSSCGSGGVACQDCTQHAGGTCVGQACSSCNATNCPTGCCLNGNCQSTGFPDCGDGGQTCSSCDPKTSNRCGAAGCQCGSNPACSPGLACTDAGTCVCNSSCPGCCESNVCYAQTGDTCGISGSACISCKPRADTCTSSGGCTCDGGTVCASDQVCAGGRCTCIPSQCTGCCNGDHCLSGTDLGACGTSPGYCIDCTTGVGPNSGDKCCSGQCRCGGNCGGLGGPGVQCTGSQKCLPNGLLGAWICVG